MKRLNAYRFTHFFIQEGMEYLRGGTIPERYEFPSRQKEFESRYSGMRIADGHMWYGALQVVAASDIHRTLAKLYAAIGDIGRDRFYALVKSKYVGISRPQVQTFLNNQEVHQLVQQVKRQRVNKAIVASKPMERWQADLVDVSKYQSPQNGNTTFLLTVIDCFSKFAWVEPLKNKQAITTATALERIIKAAGGTPVTLQTDNGGEFEEEFERVLAQHRIIHARSRAYNPQANGQIERFNGTLKRMIYVHMLKNNTKTYLSKLQEMVALYNTLLHTGTQQTPQDAHNKTEITPKVAKQLQTQAIRSKKRGRQFKRPPLNIGDTVRVALIHQAMEKPVTFWTKELFQVMWVVAPVNAWDAATYVLHDGRKFTRDRLQKVNRAELVTIDKKSQAPPDAPKQKKPKEPVAPRAQPSRERAPSSTMKDHYVDY